MDETLLTRADKARTTAIAIRGEAAAVQAQSRQTQRRMRIGRATDEATRISNELRVIEAVLGEVGRDAVADAAVGARIDQAEKALTDLEQLLAVLRTR